MQYTPCQAPHQAPCQVCNPESEHSHIQSTIIFSFLPVNQFNAHLSAALNHATEWSQGPYLIPLAHTTTHGIMLNIQQVIIKYMLHLK